VAVSMHAHYPYKFLHVYSICLTLVCAQVCRLLLSAGADPLKRDSKGRTPAVLARQQGRLQTPMLLSAFICGGRLAYTV
jgi:hypothetical protein